MVTSFRFRFLWATVAAATCALSAAFAEPSLPLSWPAFSPVRMEVASATEVFDEVPVQVIIFSGSELRLRSAARGDWICQPEPTPRLSLLLRHAGNPAVTLGLAIYPRAQFLRDLDDETWQRYLSGIRARYGPTLVALSHVQDQTYFLGRHNREVTYTVQVGADLPLRTLREIFVLEGDRVVVATAEGDADELAPLNRSIDQFLSRLNLAP